MPEGPEVAFIANQLNKELKGKSITSFDILGGRYSRHAEPDGLKDFRKNLPMNINEVEFKGKLIIFHFEDEEGNKWWMFNTLGMSGGWSVNQTKHSHLRLGYREEDLDEDEKDERIYFTDQRCFGTVKFINDEKEYNKKMKSIPGGFLGKYLITFDEFKKNVEKKKDKNIAKCLMDQKSICSGVGNYLLSEICFSAAVNPWKDFDSLDDDDVKFLYDIIKEIIEYSYKAGGASIKNYSDLNDNDGEFVYDFQVYMQEEDPNGYPVIKKEGPHGRTIHVSTIYDW